MKDPMPKIIHRTVLLVILLAMFPPLLVARSRALRSDEPRVHLIQDMDNQPKLRAQHTNEMFADHRAMRPHPPGTVARGDELVQMPWGAPTQIADGPALDDHFYRGLQDGAWANEFPQEVPMSQATLQRGRERFNIYCAPCHGESGNGYGIVSVRAAELQALGQAQWVTPTAMYDPTVLVQPVGQLFNTVTYGIRTMPAYGPQVPEADRWAIIAWVKVLQRAQVARWDELPPEQRERMEEAQQQAIIEQREAEQAAREAEARQREREAAQQQADENQQNEEVNAGATEEEGGGGGGS